MDFALTKVPDERFAQPQIDLAGVKPIIRGDYIDSSMLIQQAQSGSSTIDMGSMLSNIHDILYFVDRDDPQGPYPSNPWANDDAFENWEYAVQAWKNATYSVLLQSTSTPAATATTTTPETTQETTILRDDN